MDVWMPKIGKTPQRDESKLSAGGREVKFSAEKERLYLIG